MTQRDMFAAPVPSWEKIEARDAQLKLIRDFLSESVATQLLAELIERVVWRHDVIRVFGREHPLPRLHQWYGDPGKTYTWSGIRMEPQPWIEPVQRIRRRVEEVTGRDFDSVLLNFYRDGDDTVGWHADNEPELGDEPLIASVSLGAERDFDMKHADPGVPRVRIPLTHGSLLLMQGPTQQFWQHTVPRRKGIAQPRVNLTFRTCGDEATVVKQPRSSVKPRAERRETQRR